MHTSVTKTIVTCIFGAALMAGCASSPSSPAQASAQANSQRGKIVAIETVAVVGQPATAPTPTSGDSTGGTTAASESSTVTVLFNDGTKGIYTLEQKPSTSFKVGDAVQIVPDREKSVMILSP